MIVEIISWIEKIGHSIYDWQIRSGIFKARCNIEEAINLGTDTSLSLSQEKGTEKAKPYAIELSKVVSFLERFMVEIVPQEELREQSETVRIAFTSMQGDAMDKPTRSAEQMHSKMNAAMDSLMDQERASKGRQQLIGASIPTSPRETIVVDGLSATQAQRSQELFITCDTDASGAIEVAEILMVFGSNIVMDQLEELVNQGEDQGLIDLDYWQRFMVERKRSRGDKKFNHLLNLLESEANHFKTESQAMITKSGDELALTPMQIRRCTLLHEACDRDGNGTIDPHELSKAHPGARKVMSRIDLNHDGHITEQEWRDFMLRVKRSYGDRSIDNLLHYLERVTGINHDKKTETRQIPGLIDLNTIMPNIDKRDGLNLGDKELSQLAKHRKIIAEELPEICRVDPGGDGAYPRPGDPSEELPTSPAASPRGGAQTPSGRQKPGVRSRPRHEI